MKKKKKNPSRAASFSQVEQVVIMDSYEENKKYIMAKSNTFTESKAKEKCCQKVAGRVNL